MDRDGTRRSKWLMGIGGIFDKRGGSAPICHFLSLLGSCDRIGVSS